MTPQSPLTELTEQAKQLIASINGLSAWNAKTPEDETLDDILQSAKNRIDGAVENVKVAFDYYMKQSSDISPNDKTKPQV